MDRLSESMEDYLEAIAELIAVDGHAHTKEIAQKLNVKMPSVTGALRQLEQQGYIVYNTHYDYYFLELNNLFLLYLHIFLLLLQYLLYIQYMFDNYILYTMIQMIQSMVYIDFVD